MSVIYIDPYRFGGGGGAFTPDDLSDLRCWYEAESLGLADTASVGTWTDLSGNGLDLSQGTAGSKPIYQTADLNGLATVEFDGSNDFVDRVGASISPTTGHWTTFAVFNTDTLAVQQQIFNGDTTVGSPRSSQFMGLYTSDFISVPNSVAIEYATVSLSGSTWYVGEAVRDATTCQAFVNGTTGSGATSIGSPGEPTSDLVIGRHPTGGLYFNGRIAEVIGYSRALNSTERTQVRDYLTTKYAL